MEAVEEDCFPPDMPILGTGLAPLPEVAPPAEPTTSPNITFQIGINATSTTFTLWTPSSPLHAAFSKNNVIILDWDNTILPSDWLMRTHFITMEHYIPPSPEVLEECTKISDAVESLFRLAQTLGQVLIVTNASTGWVEKTCAMFMPGLCQFLGSIPVISACELYELFYSDVNTWKLQAFRRDVLEALFSEEEPAPRVVLSIGDSESERNAVRMLKFVSKYGPVTTKSLKFIERPTPIALVEQIKKTTTNLSYILAAEGHMDLFMGITSRH